MVMKKTEIKMIVAQEALDKARKEHDEAVTELLLAKKKGVYTEEHHRKENQARAALMQAENRLRKAKEAAELENAITDEEAAKLGDYFAGNSTGWKTEPEELSEIDEALINAIVDGLD